MSDGGYPAAYRRRSSQKHTVEKRLGFQMPIVPTDAPPALPEFLQSPGAKVVAPSIVAAEELATDVVATRVFAFPHPVVKALAATYWIYRLTKTGSPSVPDPGSWVPDMGLPFDFEGGGWYKYNEGFPETPYIGVNPAVYDGVAGGYATAKTYTYWWENVPYPGAYNADGLATRVVGYPSAYEEQNPPVLEAGTGIVVEWASITNDFQTGVPNSTLGVIWKYWPGEGMTPAEDLQWTGPVTPGTGVTTRIIAIEVDEYVVGWGTATEAGYEVVETTEMMHHNSQRPAVVTGFGVSPAGKPLTQSQVVRQPIHDNTVPGARVRERKFIANVSARSLLGIVGGAVTEGVDGITAVWKALPPEYRTGMKRIRATNLTTYNVLTLTGWEWRTKEEMGPDVLYWNGKKDKKYNPNGYRWKQGYYPSPQEMARDLWKHHEKIDWSEAIWNLASNEIEDRAYAKMSPSNTTSGRQWLERTQRPVGFETGAAM